MSDTAPKITVKFLSDWHIGSGTGRTGDVDRLVRRDRYHTPFVPGKTITGILRDACERVAHALDSDSRTTAAESETTENPTWTDWVTFLFGNHPKPGAIIPPAPAHLHISSAHLPTELRKAIANKPALQSALTFVKPGVKIDSVSGTAEDKHFRLVEMARGGISLQASYSLEGLKDATEEQMAAQALLVAGAAVVERMGSKRRRGAGRCTLSIGSFSLKQALKTLQDNSVPPAPPDSQPKPTTEAYADDSVTEKGWTTIPVTLVTQQPVIISKGTVGNVVQSLDYIPGTHLLPIVARHLGSQGVDVREAIAKSHLIITNALPSIDGRATAPTPFAWFYEKQTSNLARALGNGEKQRTYLNATNKLWGEPEDGKQRKQFRGSYITPEFVTDSTTADSKAVERVEVSLGIETHNTVDDTSQRPTSDVGGVYSYQAIPIGTKLRAELRLHPALCAQLKGEPKQWFASLHQQTHSVGVSRKDEYGNLRLEIGQPVLTKELSTSEQKSDCVDSSKTDSSELENSKVLVWLTSDLLLRNQWLQPTSRVEDLLQALTEALQLPAGSLTELPFTVSQPPEATGDGRTPSKPPAPILARQSRNESWQTRWGLPRPTLAGLAAGSCFCFMLDSSASISAEACRQLEMTGLGERRVEGYGQLRIDAAILRKETVEVFEPASEESSSDRSSADIKDDSEADEYLKRIEETAWREAIYRAATTLANQSSIRQQHLGFRVSADGRSTPTLTQLGGLRAQLMAAISSREMSSTCEWLETQIGKGAGAETAFKQVKQLLESMEQGEDIWAVLNFSDTLKLDIEDLCRDIERGGELKTSLRLEAIEVFVSECIRAQSRECEQKQRSSQSKAMASTGA